MTKIRIQFFFAYPNPSSYPHTDPLHGLRANKATNAASTIAKIHQQSSVSSSVEFPLSLVEHEPSSPTENLPKEHSPLGMLSGRILSHPIGHNGGPGSEALRWERLSGHKPCWGTCFLGAHTAKDDTQLLATGLD